MHPALKYVRFVLRFVGIFAAIGVCVSLLGHGFAWVIDSLQEAGLPAWVKMTLLAGFVTGIFGGVFGVIAASEKF